MEELPENFVIYQAPVRSRLTVFEPFSAISLTGWLQQFNNYCTSGNIPEEPLGADRQPLEANNTRRAVFLNHLGDRAYEVLRKACLPAQPDARPIAQLVAILKNQFENPGLVETNRQRFQNRVQQNNETAHDFVYALQALAAECDFSQAEYGSTLKSRLIGGLRDVETRQALLMQSSQMNYEQTKTLFLQIEAIKEQARCMARANIGAVQIDGDDDGEIQVAHFQGRRGGRGGQQRPFKRRGGAAFRPPARSAGVPSNGSTNATVCWRCGKANAHSPQECPAKEWFCFQCHAKGHTARQCVAVNQRSRGTVHTLQPEGQSSQSNQVDPETVDYVFPRVPDTRTDDSLEIGGEITYINKVMETSDDPPRRPKFSQTFWIFSSLFSWL